MVSIAYRKTSLHRDRPNTSLRLASSDPLCAPNLACAARSRTTSAASTRTDDADKCPAPRAYPFFTMSRNHRLDSGGRVALRRLDGLPHERHPALDTWWSQTGSNRRPPACKAGALPTELWPLQIAKTGGSGISGSRRDRCCDLARPTLQVSIPCRYLTPGIGGPGKI